MSAMAYRFCKDYKFYLKIVNTYILPIIEYASVIWHQDNKTRESDAINTDDRYLGYYQRLKKLNLLSLRSRRILNSICVIDKITIITDISILQIYVTLHFSRVQLIHYQLNLR